MAAVVLRGAAVVYTVGAAGGRPAGGVIDEISPS